jgi:hypothetical protein
MFCFPEGGGRIWLTTIPRVKYNVYYEVDLKMKTQLLNNTKEKGVRFMDNKDNEITKDVGQRREKARYIMNSIKKRLFLLILFIGLILVVGLLIKPLLLGKGGKGEEIVTVSTLEKIIKISELSTFQAVYNGVAKGMNEKSPDQLDYYVSYNAKVYAGFDFEKVEIAMDEDEKKIIVTIPEIEITDINVDIASLDYIFINEKANKSTVSGKAYKECKADATNESENVAAIYDLAEQNAKNIMKALISPFVEQLDSNYELEIN